MEEKVLIVIQETEILGKKIKMYGSVEYPWFVASDVSEWIEHTNTSMMLHTQQRKVYCISKSFLGRTDIIIQLQSNTYIPC